MARGPRTLLLVALLLLTVAVAVNYERNLRADLAARPFGGYEDAEIALLLDAYRGEVETRTGRVAARPGDAVVGGSSFQDHVRAFEEARRRNDAWREELGELGAREAMVRALQAEQRERAASERTLEFLRRLFTV
jgi:hypothetical protein